MHGRTRPHDGDISFVDTKNKINQNHAVAAHHSDAPFARSGGDERATGSQRGMIDNPQQKPSNMENVTRRCPSSPAIHATPLKRPPCLLVRTFCAMITSCVQDV
ncbi:hypothetical protein Y032_0120g895 [Ancylostoma ceylanicum]|uniref:Uncharacterized protein n=1 Tax=Ancylostoma ceylanicum TaxID=53326 RepID=A0A016TAQ2_9BILA|nr:hypothetical protein Y032_0120g895 [Ancylostoma ceylanicum]